MRDLSVAGWRIYLEFERWRVKCPVYKFIAKTKCKRIKLAAMDMWMAFRNSTLKNALEALIIYDKFHIMRHLSKALDQVRREEYKRLSGKDRSFIKGQRYTLLSNKESKFLRKKPTFDTKIRQRENLSVYAPLTYTAAQMNGNKRLAPGF